MLNPNKKPHTPLHFHVSFMLDYPSSDKKVFLHDKFDSGPSIPHPVRLNFPFL